MYVLALTKHTLEDARADPWVLQVQGMVTEVLRVELDKLEGGGSAGSEVAVALGDAAGFGWGAAKFSAEVTDAAPPHTLPEALAVSDMAAYRVDVLSPLSGEAREAQAAALPALDVLVIALGLAAEAAANAPRRLIGVVRELEVAIALAQPAEADDGGATTDASTEPQLGALSEPVIASELIAAPEPIPATQSQAERVLDEVANVQSIWSSNTSAAAAAATMAPLVSFSNTSPDEAYKILGAFATFMVALLVLVTLAQELAKALGFSLRPLARPRTQLMVLRNSVGITCQVGATAMVSLDPIACVAGVVLIALATGVCLFCARVVRRALGITGGGGRVNGDGARLPQSPSSRSRFLAVPHVKPRGTRGAPSLSERLLGRASIANGVWEDADASDSFVLSHGNVFENYIGTPLDKEAVRAMPWTVATVRLPWLGLAIKSATLRASYNVIQLVINAVCGIIAGLGAACGTDGACNTAVLSGVGAGTLAQILLAMSLTPYIDRPRHVLDLLNNSALLGSIVCAILAPDDKKLVVALQIAALIFKVAAVGTTFYKRVIRFAATRRITRRRRRVTLARLSVTQLGLEGGWEGDEESGTVSVVNPLAAGPDPAQAASALDTPASGDREGGLPQPQASLAMQAPAEGEEGTAAELEAELVEWSRAMSAFSDDARPRLSVTAEDSFEGGKFVYDEGNEELFGANGTAAAMFAAGRERQRAATETMNPLYAMMGDSAAALSGDGLRPTWRHAARLLLALSASAGREAGGNELEADEEGRLEAELEAISLVVDIVAQLLCEESDRVGDAGSSEELWGSLQAALGALSALQGGEGSRAEAVEALKACAGRVHARCSAARGPEADGAASDGLLDLLELLSGARRMLRAVEVDNDPTARMIAARARAMTDRADIEEQLIAARANLKRARRKGAGWRKVRALAQLMSMGRRVR